MSRARSAKLYFRSQTAMLLDLTATELAWLPTYCLPFARFDHLGYKYPLLIQIVEGKS